MRFSEHHFGACSLIQNKSALRQSLKKARIRFKRQSYDFDLFTDFLKY